MGTSSLSLFLKNSISFDSFLSDIRLGVEI